MANFAPDRPGVAGAAPTVHNAAAGDSFDNNGQVFIRVVNTSGGSITMTVDDPNSIGPVGAQSFNPDTQVSIPTASTRVFGPYPVARFNDVNGRVQLAWGSTPGASLQWEAYSS